MRTAALLICTTLGVVSIRAAQAPLAFEAASVKPNSSGGFAKEIGPAPGGRFIARNNTFRDLIPFAYAIPQQTASFRIVGGPTWIDEDRFDITANVVGSWTPQQMSEMLRTLLIERFKLAAHAETRELPTYALVAASQTLGPSFDDPKSIKSPVMLDAPPSNDENRCLRFRQARSRCVEPDEQIPG